ncbi:ammonia-forming cytochrome c nitrite reductase subunit c552 [Marinilabiliaceae bacterium JC017]|nr:ammonia-forming cytochrome c nitrite reductase subunit c552 [Marinilabiliaceae bacterium JC017]
MKKKLLIFSVFIVVVAAILAILYPLLTHKSEGVTEDPEGYYGSVGCRQCHERFYELWASSNHGLAIQNINAEFALNKVPACPGEIAVDSSFFRVEVIRDSLFFIERKGESEVMYPATFALGGKNIYYFLTPFEKGRLQVMPLAYDINRDEWYNNPKSAIRHFSEGVDDEALPWRHISFTYNTSCYSCHVSQLTNNYDLATNSYHTTWKENGINCETCHGPSGEHVKVCMEAKEGEVPEDLKIIVTRDFTHEQQNASCAPCHAKMHPISPSFAPGDRFFDHYNLTTLENRDFYPDGRDLGENYTHTTWLQSPCTQSGQLDCVHCHTSSGRYRFKEKQFNNACLPCHQEQVNTVEAHSHHPAGSAVARCISCHMPMTEFARMHRSDHSMRPPVPLATKEFGSPNACNICHTEETPDWAQKHLVKWNKTTRQKKYMAQGRLIRQSRDGKWKNINKMLAAIESDLYGEVVTNSLVRLLRNCPNERKWPVIYGALKNPSPLVRSSAAESFAYQQLPGVVDSLLPLTRDDYRLVRIQAANALSTLPDELLEGKKDAAFQTAMKEFITSHTSRPDDFGAQAALGNFYFNKRDFPNALKHFKISTDIYPENLGAHVNSGLIYSFTGQNDKAQSQFQKALSLDPENEVTHLNYALLMGEMGKRQESKTSFEKVLELNPRSAVAAFNLSVLVANNNLSEAVRLSGLAWEIDAQNPKYGYTYGYFLYSNNQKQPAIKQLKTMINRFPTYTDSYFFLYDIYMKNNQKDEARKVLLKGVENEELPMEVRTQFQQYLSSK